MRANIPARGGIKITSSELQKDFPLVYKNFFNTHDIVLSGANVLTWGTDISHGMSALRVKQKLPTKTFCGASLTNSGKITFRNIFQYSTTQENFKVDDFHEIFHYDFEAITLFLQDFLQENDFTSGIEIDFLGEVPPGRGFASSGTLSVLLTHLLYVILGKIDIQDLPTRELAPPPELFEEMYDFSLRLSHCISGGKSTGASNYTVMVPGVSLPVVHLSRKSIVQGEIHTEGIVLKDSLLNFLKIESPHTQNLLLDYGVIFAGMSYKFHEIESTRELAKRENDRLNAFITSILETLPIQETDRTILSDLLNFSESEVSRQSIDNTNFRILEWFDYLLRNNYTDSAVKTFIHTIKSIGLSSFACQEENKLFFAIKYLFRQYQQFEDEEIGICPFNTGKIGGSLFFVMQHEKSRGTLQKVLDHLQKDGYIVSLDYASWRDGVASSWVCIDQYISGKLYSEYTKEGNVFFYDTLWAFYCGDYDTILENEKDCMLLDTLRGKIYIGGEKLTSKEIHSQNTAIDMLKIIIENLGQDVSNSQLPVSTYSQNKNEIIGKVVLPVKRIANAYFKKELALTCSWGITDYYLRLDRDDKIRIGIIRKLQE